MASEKVVREKGFTPRAVIIGSVYMAIMIVIFTLLWGIADFPPGHAVMPWGHILGGFDWTIQWQQLPLIFFLTIILFGLMSLTQKSQKFTPSEYALIYTMMLVAFYATGPGFYSAVYCFLGLGAAAFAIGDPNLTWFFNSVPSLWVPPGKSEIFNGALYGGSAVPWNVWMGPIAFWFAFMISYCFMFVFMAALLRRLYVDVEALQFPLAHGAVELINSSATKNRPSLFSNKWLWIGFFGGFMLELGEVIHFWYQGVKAYRWVVDLTPTVSVTTLPWATAVFCFDPWVIGFGYLLPMDILMSTTVFTLVFNWILPPALAWSGFVPSTAPSTGYLNMWGGTYGWGGTWATLPEGWHGIWFGSLIGIVIWSLWAGRGQVVNIFKWIVNPPKDLEAEEPLPYKLLWAGVILFALVQVGLLSASGIPVTWTFVFLFLMSICYLSYAVVRAESGWVYGGYDSCHWWPWAYSLVMAALSIGMNENLIGITFMFSGLLLYWSGQWWHPLPHCLESYKIGQLTNTKTRDLLSGQLIAYIVSFAVGMPLLVISLYTFGLISRFKWSALQNWSGGWEISWGNTVGVSKIYFVGGLPTSPTYILGILAGAIVSIILYAVRLFLPVFPLHPAGIPNALLTAGLAFPAYLISWIIKKVTIRVYGTAFYEEKGLPLAVGLVASQGLVLFMGSFGRLVTGYV